MGEYCTVRDVRTALTPSALAADTETAAKLPDWQLEDAILEAEGIIKAFLLARCVITPTEVEEINPDNPLETWIWVVAPTPIRGWARDIAAWLATLTFRRHKDLPEDDPIRLRYLMVLGFLTSIRDREMSLPLPEAEDSDQGVHVENLYEGKMFHMGDFGLVKDGSFSQVQRMWPYRADV